jgi:hypothetical protein
MEKRSRRRIRDLVTQLASQGLSENEIGCARISMMARGTSAPFKGRIQKRKTKPLHRSNPACIARPVHTVGSFPTEPAKDPVPGMSASPQKQTRISQLARPHKYSFHIATPCIQWTAPHCSPRYRPNLSHKPLLTSEFTVAPSLAGASAFALPDGRIAALTSCCCDV